MTAVGEFSCSAVRVVIVDESETDALLVSLLLLLLLLLAKR